MRVRRLNVPFLRFLKCDIASIRTARNNNGSRYSHTPFLWPTSSRRPNCCSAARARSTLGVDVFAMMGAIGGRDCGCCDKDEEEEDEEDDEEAAAVAAELANAETMAGGIGIG